MNNTGLKVYIFFIIKYYMISDFSIDYIPFTPTELCILMGYYGSDKGHYNI